MLPEDRMREEEEYTATGKSKKAEENNCKAGHVTERSPGAPVHRAMDKAVLPG